MDIGTAIKNVFDDELELEDDVMGYDQRIISGRSYNRVACELPRVSRVSKQPRRLSSTRKTVRPTKYRSSSTILFDLFERRRLVSAPPVAPTFAH